MQARIERIQGVARDLRRFWLRLDEPLENFVPGRYCTLVVGGVKRPYSIVKITDDATCVELFIELVENGALTSQLWELGVGGRVGVLPRAKGIFTLDPDFNNHIMVATVTGIVPFMSMLYEYLPRKDDENRFFVFYGASYEDELAYHEELIRLSREYPDKLTYVTTISRPVEARNEDWAKNQADGREVGRVNDVLGRYIDECSTAPFLGNGIDCHSALLYVCGHPGMMTAVKEMYARFGWDIKEEAFWH